MKNSNSPFAKVGFLFFVSLTLMLLSACTVYQDSPAPSASVTYVEASAGDDLTYVEIRSEDDFYEPLSPYGRWEEVSGEGRCWIPARVDRDWRPYSSGHWRRTDAGWYWDSDEPWGWATYHYGRWDRNDEFGWYWVPETQWAPSWVSWHQGGGYVGWAPLRPSGRSRRGVSVDVSVRDDSSPQAYVFVQERQFLQPVRPTNIIVNNTTVINQTTNITNIKVVNKTVINEGPRTEVIERATGEKIQTVPARTVRREKESVVAAPHPAAKTNPTDRRSRPVPNATPVRQPRPASAPVPVPSAAPVAPSPSTRERPLPGEQKERPPAVRPAPAEEKPIRPAKEPEIEREKGKDIPAVQKKTDDNVRPRAEKPKKPAEESPKKPAPKQQKRVKELPEQAKGDPEKGGAEKHAKDKERDDADQPGKSESSK